MIAWLRENEDRSRREVLRDLTPEQRERGMIPELDGVKAYEPEEFQEKVDWMVDRRFLKEAPRGRAQQVARSLARFENAKAPGGDHWGRTRAREIEDGASFPVAGRATSTIQLRWEIAR